MKKQILSLALAFALVLALAPAVGPVAQAASPGTYNAGDIAVFNTIIDNNNLGWLDKADPADGSYVPNGWGLIVTWSDAAANKRVISLNLNGRSVSGALDVSNLTALESLFCNANYLTALDVTKDTALTWLDCGNNNLIALDVSQNTALEILYCQENQLTALDVTKNTALTALQCYTNQLTTLDVTKNTALEELNCYDNKLTSLDVTKNTVLTSLTCSKNQLAALNVSENTALSALTCWENQLTALDVSANTDLRTFLCSDNQLTVLDVTKNTRLTRLDCGENQLTALDVTKNTAWLERLDCYNNQLTVLDVTNNNRLTRLNCAGNNMGQDADIGVPGWRNHWNTFTITGFNYFPQGDRPSDIDIPTATITVTAPATRATPVTTAPAGGTGYTCGPVIWTPTIPATGKFAGRTAYTATVTLTADDGYTFPEDFTSAINGKTATVTDNTGGTVTIAYTFSNTAPTGNGVEVTVGVKTFPAVQVTITIFLSGAPIYEGTFPKN